MSVATILLWILALVLEPGGHLDFSQAELWMALAYLGVIAGPTGTWAAVSVARALPPVTARSACWARHCSPSPRRSSWSASP